MTTLKEIDAQLTALKAQREEVRKSELKTAVDKVRSLVTEYGLTESDVFPPARGARSTSTAGTKVAPKYRDPATGATWTGRGKAPKWIEGQEREKFAIWLRITGKRKPTSVGFLMGECNGFYVNFLRKY